VYRRLAGPCRRSPGGVVVTIRTIDKKKVEVSFEDDAD
jgi:hypothetical protein